MQTCARQGGTFALFVGDDGLLVLSLVVRDARLAFYATHKCSRRTTANVQAASALEALRHPVPEPRGHGLRGVGRDTGGLADDDLEECALGLAIEEVSEESGRK